MRIYERLPGRIHAARAEARLAGAMATDYLERLSSMPHEQTHPGSSTAAVVSTHGSEGHSRDH